MLAVNQNPNYPMIIDVEGLDMDFSVTGSIFTGRIDITGNDRIVKVWMGSGSFVGTAFVQWLPSLVSRNNAFGKIWADPDDEITYGLENIPSSTGTLMQGGVIYSSFVNQPMVLVESSTSLYYGKLGTNNFIIALYRKGLNGISSLDKTLNLSSNYQARQLVSVKDGELLGLSGYGTDGDSGYRTLNRYNLNPNATGTITTLYSDSAITPTESWISLTINNEPGSEHLIAMSQYTITGSYHGIARVFDANTGSLIRKTTINFPEIPYVDPDGLLHTRGVGLWGNQEPQIFTNVGTKYVAYLYSEEWTRLNNYPWHWPDYWYFSCVLIYNPDSGAYVTAYSEAKGRTLFNDIGFMACGADYNSSCIYWLTSDTEADENRLYKALVSDSPGITLVDTLTGGDTLDFVIGKSKLYHIYYPTGEIVETGSMSQVGDSPFSITGTTTAFARQISTEFDVNTYKDLLWFVGGDPMSLCGVKLGWDQTRTIFIATGTNIPSSILYMNLVPDGVAFTSVNELGLIQKP